ncbi:Ribonuclease HI-related protein 2, partial [hydrothermal vent metagenome]
MAQKFYVVWQGRKPGIYTNWNQCKQQVDKFAGAKYKSFSILSEAEKAFKDGSTRAVIKGGGGLYFSPTKTQRIKTYTARKKKALPIMVK